MGKMFKRLPSPSMAVAFIALLAALGGTAVALPGSNNVTSGDIRTGAVGTSDIKNNSGVRTQDIRNSTIRGRDIRNSTIRGADVGANSLTGSDINEGTLGTVPSANTANNANTANSASSASTAGSIGGVQLQRFRFTVPGAEPETTILNFGGLVLKADCSGATLDFFATTTTNDAQLDGYSVDPTDAPPPVNDNLANNDDLDATETVDLVPSNEDNEVGQLRYSRPDGGGVHVEWHAHTAGSGTGCAVNGVASAF